jgi:hypothetical protein
MVRGLEIFKEHFKEYTDNYVIIGGTACDVILDDGGFTPRATKDIDLILVVEALTSDFVKHFWKFIEEGNYERTEKSDEDRKYYRFIKPQNREFPFQVEFFSRNPDLLDLDEGTHLTPIPVDENLASLSAILLDDVYYKYLIENSRSENGLHRSDTHALMCLKAKAYNDIKQRIEKGSGEDSRQLNKHKGDIFRLAMMLTPDDNFELPDAIKEDVQLFANNIKDDLPGKQMFKSMGLSSVDPTDTYQLIIDIFNLDNDQQ